MSYTTMLPWLLLSIAFATLLLYILRRYIKKRQWDKMYPELDEESVPLRNLSLDKLLVHSGAINLTYDSEMKQGKWYIIEANIFTNIKNAIKSKFTELIEIKTSSVMKVELFANNFEVKSLSTLEQFILDDTPTPWKWQVKPLKSGNQFIEVRASISIIVPEHGEKFRDFEVLRKEIKVEVNAVLYSKELIVENWKWLTAIATIIGLIFTYLNYIKPPSH